MKRFDCISKIILIILFLTLTGCKNQKSKHNHVFDTTIIEATCTEDGYSLHTCECGESYIDNDISKLGHNFNDWDIIEQPSQTQTGMKVRKCKLCEFEESEVIPLISHEHEYIVEVIPASCQSQGYRLTTCKSCDYQLIDNFSQILDHMFSDWHIIIKATDEKLGIKQRICNDCEFTETLNYELLTPNYTIPTDLTCTVGQSLTDIQLPEGFKFHSPNDSVFDNVGEYIVKVFYKKPNDLNCEYKTVTNIDIKIQVLPIEIDITQYLLTTRTFEYNAMPISLPYDISEISEIVSVTFKKENVVIEGIPFEAGSYEMIIEVINSNYKKDKVSCEFVILKNSSYLETVVIDEFVYTGEPVDVSKEFKQKVEIIYKQNGNVLDAAPTEIGEYCAIIKLLENENYMYQEKEYTFSIIVDNIAPIWCVEKVVTTNNTLTLDTIDHSKIAHYVIMKHSMGPQPYELYLITENNEIELEDGVYICRAIDDYGNESEILNINILNEEIVNDEYIPKNIYPADGSIIDASYTQIYADNAISIVVLTGEYSSRKCYGYIDKLKNGITYYWYAVTLDGICSPKYSFTVSYEDEHFQNVSPLDGAIVYDKCPMLTVIGSNDFTIYYTYRIDSKFNEYIHGTSILEKGYTYYWYAEDKLGNKTETWSFIYKGNVQNNTGEVWMDGWDEISYTNENGIFVRAYSSNQVNYFKYYIIHADGTKNLNYSTSDKFYPDDKNNFYTFVMGSVTNGDEVHIAVVDKKLKKALTKIVIVDMENPINGIVVDDNGDVTIKKGTDNIGANYYYRINLGEWIEFTSDVNIENLESYVIDLKAIDYAGNITINSYSSSNSLEDLPVLEIVNGKLNELVNTDVTVRLTPNSLGTSSYFINGIQYELLEEKEITFIDEGNYEIYLKVETKNEDTIYSKRYEIMIDKTPPVFGQLKDNNHQRINGTKGFEYAYFDFNEIKDENEFTVYTKIDEIDSIWHETTLSFGKYRLNFYTYIMSRSGYYHAMFKAVDKAGNESIFVQEVLVDSKGPSLDDFDYKREYDDESDTTTYKIKIENIIDDYGECAEINVLIMDDQYYHTGEGFYKSEEFIMESGQTTFEYDFSYLEDGKSYVFVIVAYDDIRNLSQTKAFMLHKYNGKIIEEGDFKFIDNGDKYILVSYMGTNSNIVLPNNINNKHYEIASWTFLDLNIESIVISSAVTKIGYGAFYNCKTLKNITIDKSVTQIDVDAFLGCNNIENIYYNGTIEEWGKIIFGDDDANPKNKAKNFNFANDDVFNDV